MTTPTWECPTCHGAGVIDTSPPAAFRAPWLASDTTCPECHGTGNVPNDPTPPLTPEQEEEIGGHQDT